jgi:hypothetical protein
MASAVARTLPLMVTNRQKTKRNNVRRMVKINLELSPDRQQFANLFLRLHRESKTAEPFRARLFAIVVSAVA